MKPLRESMPLANLLKPSQDKWIFSSFSPYYLKLYFYNFDKLSNSLLSARTLDLFIASHLKIPENCVQNWLDKFAKPFRGFPFPFSFPRASSSQAQFVQFVVHFMYILFSFFFWLRFGDYSVLCIMCVCVCGLSRRMRERPRNKMKNAHGKLSVELIFVNLLA